MKKLIMLAIVLGLLMSGCATTKTYTHESWVKSGASPQQLQRDYAECQGPLYVKADMANYETDLGFCVDAERARGARADSWRIWSSTVSFILDTATKGLCDRCMKSKGYEKINNPESGRDTVSCMESKGWEWKVIEERIESKKDIPKTPTPTPNGGKGGIDNRPPWQR